MAVIRPSFPEDHYTRVPNAWLRDPLLDPAPKAYLAYLLSHAAGYRCSTSQAARDMGVNRSTVTAWNAKLVERGYFLAVEQRQDDAGRFVENDYAVTSCTATAPPLPDNRAPSRGEPARSTVTEKPRTVEPSRSDRARSTQHIEEQGEKNTERRPGDELLVELPLDGLVEPFDEFWTAYPRKVGKADARKAWAKALRRVNADKIVAAVREYPFRDDLTFVPHPASWLNGGRWEDDPHAVNPSRTVTGNGYRAPGPYRDPDPDEYRGAL